MYVCGCARSTPQNWRTSDLCPPMPGWTPLYSLLQKEFILQQSTALVARQFYHKCSWKDIFCQNEEICQGVSVTIWPTAEQFYTCCHQMAIGNFIMIIIAGMNSISGYFHIGTGSLPQRQIGHETSRDTVCCLLGCGTLLMPISSASLSRYTVYIYMFSMRRTNPGSSNYLLKSFSFKNFGA
jgi:hypothetical protein